VLFSLTVAASVAVVAWTVLVRIRHVFEQRDQEETALFVNQFQREFQHRSQEVAADVERLAASERMRSLAFQLAQSGDASPYLTEAQAVAQDAQLDFLEIVGPDGNIVSSAQSPARFGYPEPAVSGAPQAAFLKREELTDGSSTLGLFAVHAVNGTAGVVKLIGGERLDQRFLADLAVAPGMEIGLYSDVSGPAAGNAVASVSMQSAFDPARLQGQSGPVADAAHYQGLITAALNSGRQTNGIVDMNGRREDSLNATAIPLTNPQGTVMAVLTVAIARGGMVAAQQHIRAIAYGVAGSGILLAIILSLWIAARVSRPIEQLAHAAEEVASGNWNVHVQEKGRDELSVLASSFNHMTHELTSQRERLVQSERVAAWRELARRLAHELKNPLFPLQITVENLARARALPESEFDEVFRESTSTLSTEIANLKKIIGRFSDFSKMPKPELERVDIRDVVERARALYASQATTAHIVFNTDVAAEELPANADPELLHRALSNLVLNAMDAMPEGGKLTISARDNGDAIELRVADSGKGLTPEECARLFTPYYTTKQFGTGLGLAIVQSVIADHAGTIAVDSSPESGAVFIITLPKAES
jgi:Signal transduction histidine kinase involved in nitrogen fixation and metabolism regulation